MSYNTYKEWLDDNNLKINNCIDLVENLPSGGTPDAPYSDLFSIANNIYNPNNIPDDSATATFTKDDEEICLQKALNIYRGGI